jgi:ATP-dependent Clp protease ATP-binding subunit ClpB
VLLQVLDDGRLTDNKGRLVNFKNTIIIMTSNLGSQLIHERFENVNPSQFEEVAEKAKFEVLELLKQTIRPEFLNRIDETIMFLPLTKENVKAIVRIQLAHLKEQLSQKDIDLYITEEAFDWITESGYDPFFGARPVKRVIQKQVLNELSKALLSGTIDKSKKVVLDVFDGKVIFRKPVLATEE